ncbi:MAG: phosphoribosylaminoimidazolesuccinocarboxamide synthase [bacterium]
MKAIIDTNLDLTLFSKGKVRDIYSLEDKLLIIATDRISAFDYVLPTPIPDKGKVLTQISKFWFDKLSFVVENHFISDEINDLPSTLSSYKEKLNGRFMIVKKTNKIPIECVVRGYLAGSGLKEYKKAGTVCGIKLPPGLNESDKLPEIIFTPSTKEESGKHDENINFKQMQNVVGVQLSKTLRDVSIKLYKEAVAIAEKNNVIIADTKFEFGLLNEKLILIDEVLTPDSSRFWDKKDYQPGKAQPSFDKQFVRDYLESINWAKKPPVPELPGEIVDKTRDKYLNIYKRLTGAQLEL